MSSNTLVFDTETTGMIKKGAALVAQPFCVQIACILFSDQREVAHFSCMMPAEFRGERSNIPEESSRIHGVTDDLVDACGLAPRMALAVFNNLVKRADRIVAHNAAFDDTIVRAAYSRIAADQADFVSRELVCTMLTVKDELKLPGRYGDYKWPNLQEAHTWATGAGFDGAHDAMVDVRAAAAVYFAAVEKGVKPHVITRGV